MKPLVLALVAAFLSLSAHAADVVPEPFPPAHFSSILIEWDEGGKSTLIQSSGDTVNFKVTEGDKVVENITVTPSPDDWFKFIQGLNAAKVYKWAPHYEYPGQGSAWAIDLVMEDRKFKSEGTNEYPLNGNESQPIADPKVGTSIPFQLFWQAALGLVGKTASPAPAK
jgi:hypothetical protein